MPLSELARYRLSAINRFADETATNALDAEAAQRAQEQANARRMAIARVVGGFSPSGDRNEIYRSATNTMMGLLPYGQEGQSAADIVNKSVESYSKLNPVFRPPNPPAPVAPKHEWVDVAESPDPTKWPLTKKFGDNVHRLQQQIDMNANKPTGYYQYAGGGTISRGDETAARLEKQDVQKQKDAHNQAASAAKSYETRYGLDTLNEWKGLMEKEMPNWIGVAMDPNIPEAEKAQQLMAAIGTVQDPVLKAKLTAVASYASASAKRDAYLKNIEDRGYYVDEKGNLVKGKKPAAAAVNISEKDSAALDWAKGNPNDPRAKKIMELLGGK